MLFIWLEWSLDKKDNRVIDLKREKTIIPINKFVSRESEFQVCSISLAKYWFGLILVLEREKKEGKSRFKSHTQ